MSYISIPDQHPGRCPNLRARGYPTLGFHRCLDYEGTDHVCTFEPDPEIASTTMATGIYSVSPPAPKPWVKPDAA